MACRCASVLMIALTLGVCSRAREYDMRGQVLGVDREKSEMLVTHDEIAGLMPAMTMPYKVHDSSLLDNLAAGDLIAARIAVSNSEAVVTSVQKTGTAALTTPAPAPVTRSGFELIRIGEQVPDQAFVDQDGRRRTLSAIRDGRALALTFIYTRCPMPTFCPLMDRNFVELQKRAEASQRLGDTIRLLSVSFDPQYDTPPILKAHAAGLGANPALWTFVTGSRDDIDRFAMRFGVSLDRTASADPRDLAHTLRTAVIDREGKLVKVYTGNEWTPAQLAADLESLP